MLQGHLCPCAQMGMFVCDMDQLDKRDTECNTKKLRKGLTSNMTLDIENKSGKKDREVNIATEPEIEIIKEK